MSYEMNGEIRQLGSGVLYKNTVSQSEEIKAIIKKIKDAQTALRAAEVELSEHIKKSVRLPAGFNVDKVYYANNDVFLEATSEKMKIILPPRPLEPPKDDRDPYQKIAGMHNLIQILNCGALTKAEKRKVLGLPETQGE